MGLGLLRGGGATLERGRDDDHPGPDDGDQRGHRDAERGDLVPHLGGTAVLHRGEERIAPGDLAVPDVLDGEQEAPAEEHLLEPAEAADERVAGPRDAVFPLRKPVMRWIPPLPIGMDWKRELPTNIRVVGG